MVRARAAAGRSRGQRARRVGARGRRVWSVGSHTHSSCVCVCVLSRARAQTARLKKNRHKRGQVTAGHGRVGKHRKHPGGRGNAGGQHHHRILMDKFHPGYFGKVGMRYFHRTNQQFHCPTLNLDRLWTLVSEQTRAKYAKAGEKDKVPVIDVTKAVRLRARVRWRASARGYGLVACWLVHGVCCRACSLVVVRRCSLLLCEAVPCGWRAVMRCVSLLGRGGACGLSVLSLSLSLLLSRSLVLLRRVC